MSGSTFSIGQSSSSFQMVDDHEGKKEEHSISQKKRGRPRKHTADHSPQVVSDSKCVETKKDENDLSESSPKRLWELNRKPYLEYIQEEHSIIQKKRGRPRKHTADHSPQVVSDSKCVKTKKDENDLSESSQKRLTLWELNRKHYLEYDSSQDPFFKELQHPYYEDGVEFKFGCPFCMFCVLPEKWSYHHFWHFTRRWRGYRTFKKQVMHCDSLGNVSQYCCTLCDFKNKSVREYLVHIFSHCRYVSKNFQFQMVNGSRQYKCRMDTKCREPKDLIFWSKETLQEHLNTHMKEMENDDQHQTVAPLQCHLCLLQTSSKAELAAHITLHKGGVDQKKSKDSLKRKRIVENSDEEADINLSNKRPVQGWAIQKVVKYRCKQCERQFCTKEETEEHVQSHKREMNGGNGTRERAESCEEDEVEGTAEFDNAENGEYDSDEVIEGGGVEVKKECDFEVYIDTVGEEDGGLEDSVHERTCKDDSVDDADDESFGLDYIKVEVNEDMIEEQDVDNLADDTFSDAGSADDSFDEGSHDVTVEGDRSSVGNNKNVGPADEGSPDVTLEGDRSTVGKNKNAEMVHIKQAIYMNTDIHNPEPLKASTKESGHKGSEITEETIKMEPQDLEYSLITDSTLSCKFCTQSIHQNQVVEHVMENHMENFYSSSKMTSIRCKKCPSWFSFIESDLRDHVMDLHSCDFYQDLEVETFKCKLCLLNVKNHQEMGRHIQRKHKDRVEGETGKNEEYFTASKFAMVKCVICSSQFLSEDELLDHVDSVHWDVFSEEVEVSRFHCSVCSQATNFQSRKEIEFHICRKHLEQLLKE